MQNSAPSCHGNAAKGVRRARIGGDRRAAPRKGMRAVVRRGAVSSARWRSPRLETRKGVDGSATRRDVNTYQRPDNGSPFFLHGPPFFQRAQPASRRNRAFAIRSARGHLVVVGPSLEIHSAERPGQPGLYEYTSIRDSLRAPFFIPVANRVESTPKIFSHFLREFYKLLLAAEIRILSTWRASV